MSQINEIVKVGNDYFSLRTGEIVQMDIINDYLSANFSFRDVSRDEYLQVLSSEFINNCGRPLS